ncbi:hypothetical protein JOF41_005755 [Saccharothrix coeruleofusca]|uniref:TFIIB-type zinc ribbon-containing protein n=1 Tax=Saccharothrix coeruleofusca TaxID=33919 RepID=UPI001AE8CC88|nr:zf-TFIIB domain-containing protein [Saccharothrix coeruleofusca]MBP2339577.1 hypothetical protein [Saccharothrix coeruleofusca]
MICPKCQDLMRTLTRGAVHIEQCDNCHGVFLDGGELEQIIAAEREHYAQPPAAPAPTATLPVDAPPPGAPPAGAPPAYQPPPPYQPPPGTPPPGVPAPSPYGGGHPGYPGHYGHPRRRSFLEELFD